jgi:hypothetical protein
MYHQLSELWAAGELLTQKYELLERKTEKNARISTAKR